MRHVFLLLVAATLFAGCEKAVLKPDQRSANCLNNFDHLWREIDRKYSFFELKKVDWNNVREVYRAKLTSTTSEEELFQVLADMLNELKDGHANLKSPFDVSHYKVQWKGPQNYNRRTVEQYYLEDLRITGALENAFLGNKSIGYIRCEAFSGDFLDEQLDVVFGRLKDTKGLVFDIRNNGGGDIFRAVKVLSRFTEHEVNVGYFITRNGPSHADFGPREAFSVSPHDGLRYTKPIVVLTDRGTYSSATYFSLACKALPHVTLLGDTTGGGGGAPAVGQLPNGWLYRFSTSQLLDKNGDAYAEFGVPPHIQLNLDWSDPTRDNILERAISELN